MRTKTWDPDVRVDVYAVGLLADVKMFVRMFPSMRRAALDRLRYSFARSWRRGSYWNGYLAETGDEMPVSRCGHGWTRARALRDLQRAVETSARYIHEPCGTSRLASPERARTPIYCVACDERAPRAQWTRAA